MKYHAFFWDFDGTLFDSYPRIARALQKALRDFGIGAPYDEVFDRVKVSLRHATTHYGALCGASSEQLTAAYRVHADEEPMELLLPYPGAARVLQGIVQNGGQNYMFTHRGMSTYAAISCHGLGAWFTDYVTSADGFPAKPAPDALQYLMKKHGLRPVDCIMVGDRDIDLDSGKNAGMAGALFDPDDYYPAYDAAYRFRHMDALYETLVDSSKEGTL